MAVASARTSVNLKKVHYGPDHGTPRHEKYTLGDELPTQLSELALRPRAMSKLHPEYTLRRLTTNDRDQVIKFLRRFFFLDEPMNQAIGLLETPDSRCVELEDYAASSLEDGISLAAVDEEGDLIGVILNGIATREEAANFTDKSETCPNAKFRRILRVLAHLELEGRPWDKLPSSCHTIMEVRIVSTHSAWRGKGLMRVLCEESERIAFDMGATAMRLDATSAFSAAAAERLGYKKVFSVRYTELPFAPQPQSPHLEAKTYLKELYN